MESNSLLSKMQKWKPSQKQVLRKNTTSGQKKQQEQGLNILLQLSINKIEDRQWWEMSFFLSSYNCSFFLPISFFFRMLSPSRSRFNISRIADIFNYASLLCILFDSIVCSLFKIFIAEILFPCSPKPPVSTWVVYYFNTGDYKLSMARLE